MDASWLLGTWRLLRADPALDFAPGVRMEFLAEGHLRYHVNVGGTEQSIALRYRVEGDRLHTELVPAGHSSNVGVSLGPDDTLLLDVHGASAELVRDQRA